MSADPCRGAESLLQPYLDRVLTETEVARIDGHLKECAPARADCTPPQAGSAFQDACTEHGFRLDVCGCEWLCAGDFKH